MSRLSMQIPNAEQADRLIGAVNRLANVQEAANEQAKIANRIAFMAHHGWSLSEGELKHLTKYLDLKTFFEIEVAE